ncbi:MAG: glycosyltransferase, partial [Nitrososphaerota archaeon]|nr:glycosyltransferase [Nitrososphaerota archaeon]
MTDQLDTQEERTIVIVMLSPTRDSPQTTDTPVSGADVRALRFLDYCLLHDIHTTIITNSYGAALVSRKRACNMITLRAPAFIERNPRLDLFKSYCLLPIMSFRALVRLHIRVVVGMSALPPDSIAVGFAALRNRSCWVFFHHWVHIMRLRDAIPRLLQFATLRMLRLTSVRILALPSSSRQVASTVGKHRVFDFKNAIEVLDPSHFERVPRIDVLYVGRISSRKGSDDLIEIWERVFKIDPTRRL